MLAIIIDDAGYNLKELDSFLALPIPLTVAVIPNLPNSTESARRVKEAGKDLIVHVPMEPDGGERVEAGAILTDETPEEIRRQLEADFASVPGALGMNNHMGSRATADEAVMRTVLGWLKEQGKLFIDSRTTAATAGPRVAQDLGMPILQRDVFLDDEPTPDQVSSWLSRVAEEALARGTAVAIGHVQNRVVADILRASEGTLAARGIHFARLSQVLSRRERTALP
ncbi:MAG TPA: divergent polysaccharide deacetylase family protein [Spirochaetia bacterium]|nr:divergent polysaccharide deacetylase family protein [Spirochaetia bacterium]